MAKKLGLYVTDRSERLALDGFSDNPLSWKRTSLLCNGTEIAKTSIEDDNLGARRRGTHSEHLVVNGAVMGTGITHYDDTNCINITLADYNKLRGGELVSGYARYSEKKVYNIVDRVDGAPTFVVPSTDGMEDVVLNSLQAISDEDKPVGLTHNTLSEQTMFSTAAPECAMRYFNPIITEGEGLSLEYFVDTKYYDSINRGHIGDTFTVLVEDALGHVLFKATTYAGQFKVTTLPFVTDKGVNVVGETWFSIRCIDNHHVGSVEHHFSVLIRPAGYTPRLYDMTSADLTTYGIAVGDNSLAAGHSTRIGLSNLFAAKKRDGYDGVRIYNANPDAPQADVGFDDPRNTQYYIDFHQDIGTGGAFVPAGSSRYFLVHYVGGVIEGINKSMDYLELADFAPFEITPGQPVAGTEYAIPADVTPYEWIRHDGAHIYRDENDKILVAWEHDMGEDEVTLSQLSNGTPDRLLRIRSLNTAIYNATTLTVDKNGNRQRTLSMSFPEGEGWYYMAWNSGTWQINGRCGIKAPGVGGVEIPDGFVIDLNKTTWRKTDCTDLTAETQFFSLNGKYDVHLTNGRLIGYYTPATVKEAFLRGCYLGCGATWENCAGIKMSNARFCSIEGVEISHSEGYELMQGFDASLAIKGMDISYSNSGYISVTGRAGSQSPIVEALAADRHDYDADDRTHVCLATTGYYELNAEWTNLFLSTINTVNVYGGKYPEMFVHFYDIKQEWKRTVKTTLHYMVNIPTGARYVRVTAYGLGHLDDGSVVLSTSAEGRLNGLGIRPRRIPEGCLIKDCYVHDTLSVAHGNAGQNCAVIGCEYLRVASVPSRFKITKAFMDIEENCCCYGLLAFHDCIVRKDSTVDNDYVGQSVIGIAHRMRYLDIRRCTGLGLSGVFSGSLIADNAMTVLSIHQFGGYGSNFQNVVKHNHVYSQSSCRYDDTIKNRYKRTGAGDITAGGNTCDDAVSGDFAIHDCFLVGAPYDSGSYRGTTTQAGALHGLAYNVFGKRHDAYLDRLSDPIKQVSAEYADWQCFDITTSEANEWVPLTYSTYLIDAIVDGQQVSAFSNSNDMKGYRFADAGAHTIYFRGTKSPKPLAYSNAKCSGLMRLPAYITKLKVDGPSTGMTRVECLCPPPAIVNNSSVAFSAKTDLNQLRAMFPSLKEIIVPANQYEAYFAHEQWSAFSDLIIPGEFTSTDNSAR